QVRLHTISFVVCATGRYGRPLLRWPFRYMRAESAAKENQKNQTVTAPVSSYSIDLTHESAF
ncbi:MAG: hypothetical protein M3Y22_03875, partial [Pseudomonadota bacterium]|nr:hypothetical protein [Pseudomonadota bacterium]